MIKDMIGFINDSPTAFSAVANIKSILKGKGYKELLENEEFKLKKGGKYYIERNGTSLIAFNVGSKLSDPSLHIAASHTDCPSFKLKPNPIIKSDLGIKLNIETYGGPLSRPWFDRPLSLAGRVMVDGKNGIETVDYLDRKPFCILASMAPHLNREADNSKLDPAVDMVPIVSLNDKYDFNKYLAKNMKVKASSILGFDLYLYPLDKGYVWGDNDEFITCHHIDNLECAYTSLMGFVDAFNDNNINVYVSFDNEEVGSLTRQGADSDFLANTIERVCKALALDYHKLVSSGMMLSCDNAHGIHPNHPEFYDKNNSPKLNGGIVIKYNANQSYTTDSLSSALLQKLLKKNNIPYQVFSNKSGIRGGSTLGNISNGHVSLITVDIGLAQWAMHSPVETCGAYDVETMINGINCFYLAHLTRKGNIYNLK